MNVIDAFLILVILISVYVGYTRGFVQGMISLLLLAVSLVVAFKTYQPLAGWLDRIFNGIGVWSLPVAFLLTFFFSRAILSIIARRVEREFSDGEQPGRLDQLFGVFPGAINGLINAALISAVLMAIPLFDGLSGKMRESTIANSLTPAVEWAEDKLAPVFDEAVQHTINKLTIKPGSEKTVELSFTVTHPKDRPDLEAKMLDLLNEERSKQGLGPLRADLEMQAVARAHSADMFARGYFSHYTPEGKSAADRARQAGVRFLVAGENLALAPTLKIAHNGLMNSPGHRANILGKSYGRVGIAILDGGRHGLMITQNFRN